MIVSNFSQPDLLTVRELQLEDVGAEVTVAAEVMCIPDVEMTEDELLQQGTSRCLAHT